MNTVAQQLVAQLKARGIDCVFGIPGVHTVELYRGLASSGLRHVTPRHEQGAGFMADGYARVTGRPGVAFVITGPGLTNILTPMAQARADSVPMLVVSGVNERATLGQGLGHLHELPDQQALASAVALVSEHVERPAQLSDALNRAFLPFSHGRPGPVHVQLPLDVAGMEAAPPQPTGQTDEPHADCDLIAEAALRLSRAERPVILAGGGAKRQGDQVRALAERLDAPVVMTVNGRGVLHSHPLSVPASPSLEATRALIEEADLVLAIGTELGPTDYDMYATGTMPAMAELIRVDICTQQLRRHAADLTIQADSGAFLEALLASLPTGKDVKADGAERAANTRAAAQSEIGPQYRAQLEMLNAIRDAVPGSILVGDSTQPVYAGNLYYDHDRPGGWFNAATGFGALGYGIPAAIGAAIGAPGDRVIAILGDGGAQFTLPEIMVAAEERLPVTFVIWNNHGYREIATSMQAASVPVLGCDPAPPDFAAAARSFGIPHCAIAPDPEQLTQALLDGPDDGPAMIEILAP